MPIRTNRYYNDPSIGAAFENIAGMFAPPDSGDAVNWVTAKAKQEQAARLADLYANPNDPNFDRRNIAVGNYTPVQSYYAQDQNNATAMRGQDITAQTSLANNAADNARALEEKRIGVAGDFARTRYGDIAPGAIRPELPPTVAGMFGLPAAPQQRGIVTLNPGEIANVPGGKTLAGTPKPLTEAEVKGQILSRQSKDVQDAAVAGDIPIETIMGDKGPVYVRRGDAVGKSPVPAPGASDSFELRNFRTPDGKTGVARINTRTGDLVNAANGQPLPDGTNLFSGSLTGTTAETGYGDTTTANRSKAGAIRASVAGTRNFVANLKQTIRNNPQSAGLAADARSFLQDAGQVVTELSNAFGGNPDAKVALDQVQGLLNQMPTAGQNYNPIYRQINAQMLSLAYRLAQADNPAGEVSIKALDYQIKNLGLGYMSSDKSVLAVLDGVGNALDSKLVEADTLDPSTSNPNLYTNGKGPAPINTPATDKPNFSASGADLPTVSTPEEAMKLPPGTKFRTPDGKVKVRP